MTYTNRSFGIEIEFVGVTKSRVAAMLRANGVEAFVEGYNHQTRNHWKIVSDSSLHHASGLTGELVSPILTGPEGVRQLETVCRVMNELEGCTVNRTCGLHVHLDCRDMTAAEVATVFERYAEYEAQIDLIMPRSRRGQARWCGSLENCKGTMKRRATKESMAWALGRYHKVNMTNIATRGAIEFRQHSGTTDFRKISNWLQFLMQFVERSIEIANNETQAPVPAIRPRKSIAYDHARRIAAHFGVDCKWRGQYYVFSKDGRQAKLTPQEMDFFYQTEAHDSVNEERVVLFLKSMDFVTVTANDAGLLDGISINVQNYFAERQEELN